jgi:hypothetical protein
MANKRTGLGMAVLTLALGLILVNCDNENNVAINVPESNWQTKCTYVNKSSYTVHVTMESGMGWSSAQFTLQPGDSKTVGTSKSKSPVRAAYTPNDLVDYISSFTGTYVDSYTCTYIDR